MRLVTWVAAPRWISSTSKELPPSVSTSTDQAMAAPDCAFQRKGSLSTSANGSVARNAAINCTVLIYLAAVLTIWSMVYYLRKALPEIRAKAR